MKKAAFSLALSLTFAASAGGAAANSDPKAATPANSPAGKAPEPAAPAAKAPDATPTAPAPSTTAPKDPTKWEEIRRFHLFQIDYDSLPPDNGNEAPWAEEEPAEKFMQGELEEIRKLLPAWEPGKVADPVQRIRNLLLVAVMPDIARVPLEAFIPIAVFEQVQKALPKDDLVKVLCWIALHPNEGNLDAAKRIDEVVLFFGDPHPDEIRMRTSWYAAKFIIRLTN